MTLTGEVILDKESKEALREEIREEVIKDIAKNGNYDSEVERYLLQYDFLHYYAMIRDTIDKVISNVDEDKEVHFQSERDTLKKLKTIQSIIKL